jgi:type IV fimbrial biogenesis protein FimT
MKPHSASGQIGFTLIELMVTLAVAAIVLTTAVPGFRQVIQNNKVATDINAFVSALHLARSESVKRGKQVTVCKSNDSASCAAANGWEQGWIVFVDTNNSESVDTGEELLRVYSGLDAGTTLRGNSTVDDAVAFQPSGFADAGSIILCDSRVKTFSSDKGFARVVIISTRGRVRLVNGDHADVTLTSCNPS